MMKSHALLTLMFLVFSTGSFMSMEQKEKGRLNFTLNHLRCIKGYSAQNMKYGMLPEDFIGKDILETVTLEVNDHKALEEGFTKALEKEITVRVPYTMLTNNAVEAKFLATITSVITENKDPN